MINAKFFQTNGEYLFTSVCSTLTVNYELNSVGTFDFQVDSATLRGHQIDRLIRMRVIVQVDGVQQATGYIHSLSMNDGVYSIRCNSLMDELTRIRSKTNAKYQDQQLIAILLDLLTYAPEWSLGDITTMIDPLVRTTVDLRGEKRLYSQIVKLLESVPNIFLREGANRQIDIGLFNQNAHPRLSKIDDLNVSTNYVDISWQVEAYGGEVSYTTTYTVIELQEQVKYAEDPEINPASATENQWVEVPVEKTDTTTRTITLGDALVYDPDLATHPQFPILSDKGTYIVRNVRDTSIANTGEFTEVYGEIAPATRENPTVDETAQAGYALWLKVVKELEDRKSHVESWSCTSLDQPPGFKVGDRVYVQSSAKRAYRDPLSGTVIQTSLEEVSQWFRVPRYSVTYDEDGTEYDMDLSETLNLNDEHPMLALYEAARKDIDPTFSDNALALAQYSILSATIPLGTSSDCFNIDDAGYFEGRVLTIPLETPPVGTTIISVYGQPFSTQRAALIRVITPPSLPAQPALVCVSLHRGWSPTYSVPVYLLVEYT